MNHRSPRAAALGLPRRPRLRRRRRFTSGSTPDPASLQFAAIDLNRYFYRYTPPRPLEEIGADIRVIQSGTERMLAKVTGGKALPA